MGERTEGIEKLLGRDVLIRKNVDFLADLYLTSPHNWLFVLVSFVIIWHLKEPTDISNLPFKNV